MKCVSSQKLKFRLAAVIGVLSFAMVFGAYYYYQNEKQRKQLEKYNELHAIGELKSGQLTQWLKERLSEAAFFSSNQPYSQYISGILSGDSATEILYRNALSGIMTDRRFNNIFILDEKGTLSYSFRPVSKIDSVTVKNATAVFQSGRIAIRDFYYCSTHERIHFEIISPVRDDKSKIIAAVVFQTDPNDYLYPLINSWPTQSKTAESYIVKQAGDRVLFLNRLRHMNNLKLDFTIPLDKTDVTAVKAVLGQEGILEGTDYRGEKVFAVSRRISDTSWFIISEIDNDELYAEIKQHAIWVFSMVTLGILLVTAVVVWYYHLRQRNFFRELLEKRSALYQAQEEFGATLYSIGDGVITTNQFGEVKHLNPAAEKLTGWLEEEARGRNIKEVFHIVNEDTREEAEIPVEKVIRDGKVVGLANHTILIAKNGTETPVADSSAPIRDSKGNLLGVIMVFSDQTEERLRRRLLNIRLNLFEFAIDHSLQEIMTKMLDETGELLQSPVGFIHFLMPDQEMLWLQAWSSRTRMEFYQADGLGLYLHFSEAGVLKDAIRRKETIIFNDYHSLRNKKGLPGIRGDVTRLMVVPVIRNNAVTAILGIGNKPDKYNGEETEILHFLADVAWEIAEHKLNEIRLRQSEERFYHLFERAPLGYQSLDENGHFVEINQAWTEALGYSKDEVIGKWFGDFILPGERETFRHNFNHFKQSGKVHSEFLMRHKDGSHRMIAFDGRIGYKDDGRFDKTHCILQDVTESRWLEEKLKESEEKMRSIFRVAPTGIGVIKDRVILEANPHLCEMTGYEASELIGRSMRVLYPAPEDYEYVGKEKYKQIARHGSGVVESRWKRKDGTVIDVLLASTPIDPSDNSKGITLTALDITEIKQAKVRLEEQKRELSSMVANLPGFIYRCNYDKDWTMLYLSDGCKQVTGYLPDDFILNRKLTFNDIIKKEYQPGIYRKWEDTIAKKSFFNDEYEIVTADKEVKWVSERGVGVYDEAGNVMFLEGYIEDITERKRTEIRLTESENKFRNLFHGHAAVKLIVDPENDSIADANEAAAEFYGWSIEELKKMKILQINALPPEEVHKIVQKVKSLKNSRFETKHRKTGGEIADVEVFASKVNISGSVFLHVIIHDITEKKKIEDALRESEERNRLIMDNSMDAILLTKPTGEVISANDAACQMFGMSENEIRDAGRKGLVDLGDPRVPKLLQQRDLNGFVMGELRFIRKDGTKFPAEISSSVFRSSRGEIYTSLVIRDITERKNWENELILAKEKAEINDKLKSAFLANMSHEIRTPMNSILGFLDLIDAPDLENETRHEYIKLVNKSGQRLLSTINDIIEISKIETGVHEVVYSRLNVRETMQFYLEFFRFQAAEKGIELVISEQITEEKALIKTDKNKLNSILTNLINNAIKFTSRGKIQLGVYEEKSYLIFYVNDTGCGIPADMVTAVFDRFIQVDISLSRTHEGSGLGLSITKAYVELLGGTIRVESEVGKGSTFSFSIPYLPVHAEIESVSGKSKPIEDSLAGKTILIAEDDETSYEFLEAVLKVKNVHLIHTHNGTDTLEAFRKNPDISVILMDIKMPGMDGYEATREIRKLDRSIPVIAQTAYALPGDREKAIEAGCDDYISKPIKAEELYAMIRKYI